MSRLHAVPGIVLTLTLTTAVGAAAWWLATPKPNAPKPDKLDKPAGPATVAKVVKEEELNTVALSEEAEKRLGLKHALVEKKATRRVRVYGGEVMVPVGRAILVAAPVSGTLRAPSGGVPRAGQAVKVGQNIFLLLPLLTPDGRASLSASLADADGQVNNAKTQQELTRIALERARRVLKEGAGSQRQVDEAQAANALADKTLEAVTARQTILNRVVGDAEAGTAAPITIDAPENGLLRVVSALVGQTVPSGAALFEIVDLSTLWVRVPLPVGDLDHVGRTEPAQVGRLSGSANQPPALATPVAAPPSANPLSATVDVFYELSNASSRWAPGQRLGVAVPLAGARESLTVPWSAVVFDVHGGTWVYVQAGPRTYARRRVVVSYTVGTDAVLEAGPAVGATIVAQGVEQLFGAETGFIK